MELPRELKEAIGEELAGLAPAGAAAGLSARYRSGRHDASGFIADARDAEAYAAVRMPATYAAAFAALKESSDCVPGFRPRSLLDAGAGTGAAAWAASALWPELQEFVLIERDGNMAVLGQRLAARAPVPPLRDARWVPADIVRWQPERHFDLAMMSYALGELPETEQLPVIKKLMNVADVLVLVEPGTKEGFARVLRARETLLESGAHIAAPCPDGVPCPQARGWCHFSARVARSRLHRQAKAAELGYEDEKFSFLVATILASSPCASRVLRHPQYGKGHVSLELCTACGKKNVVVPRSSGELYRQARALKWGSGTDKGF